MTARALLVWSCFALACFAQTPSEGDVAEADPAKGAAREATLISRTRQLTFEGRRSGEGYFSADGTELVFQSEREAGNPFYQIYCLDLESGDIEQISPGIGKTTCAWLHPSGQHVLFASTQDDPLAKQKQQEELDFRASGQERRYAWDYDATFELYRYDRQQHTYTQLSHSEGYDAEASWSPDGQWIAFTSNRHGFAGKLTEEARKNFEISPDYLNDIYIMRADGSEVRQLTDVPGYDGGPFFSPDGNRICWRRFTPNGAIAEVWTMNTDGSDQRQLTRLGAMSWAPYYHPSGEYLIFTTNRHGFANFELYLIDVEGKSAPVRVTYTNGFDGLPVFTPDGKRIAWTTNRAASKQSQIFLADWNHQHARELLGLSDTQAVVAATGGSSDSSSTTIEPQSVAASVRRQASAGFSAQDALRHVDYLCRPELQGRLTGTVGEQHATSYVAAYLDGLGLKPAGDDGSWFQQFEFTSGVALGKINTLVATSAPGVDRSLQIGQDWQPLSFSGTGSFTSAGVVFGGYGMQVSEAEGKESYDSFVHLDVKDKWVMVLRYLPENITPERRQELSRASQLRFKATVARDLGARGLIVVTGPNAKAKQRLVPLQLDGILAGSSLPVISITDDVAETWLASSEKNLQALQTQLDQGELVMGFELPGVTLAAEIDVVRTKGTGRNVLGRLQFADQPSDQLIVVGAHVDHLGKGGNGSSLARDDEQQMIHFGADDNASGVAAMLEVAEYLADQRKQGKLAGRRDILFAAWSGEELGLLGSDHFVKHYQSHENSPHGAADQAHPHAKPTLYPAIAACVNMDMVGRFGTSLILQGIGSSTVWRSEIERRNVPIGLPITLQEDSYLPTDASSFYKLGVPILSAFTGSHGEYHTPRDTPDTLNYDGVADVAMLMGLITRSLVLSELPPDFIEQAAPQEPTRGGLRAYLGTIPDYAEEVKGVLLSGARKGGPADKAGVMMGDVIVELAGRKIENIYDYTHAIEALKIGEKIKMVVQRKGDSVTLEVIPESRE